MRPEVGGPPIVAYGRHIANDETENIVLQYWLFYYDNDWFNKHEGDWELVQVMLDPGGEPQPGEVIHANILLKSNATNQIVAIWPDPENSQVWRHLFEDIRVDEAGCASLTLMADQEPKLIVEATNTEYSPAQSEAIPASWDAPDFVWMVNLLPAGEIAKGITLSLLAGIIPTILFVGMGYWVDRYEKEPKRLLAIVFLWGAIPTLMISLLARFFIQLPTGSFSPSAIEAIRTGVVVPLIEELLKGLIVVFVLLRYRREFDDTLDGIIYGAMVGFGYGMSRNILSFLGSFLIHGFAGLGMEALLTSAIYALNQAAYSAIFGAGLGYARISQK